jgi:hypothetical protein
MGRRKQDLEAWWAVAALNDPLDFPRLAAALRAGTQAEVTRKLETLVGREDPRLAASLVELLEDPPYAGLSSRPLIDSILEALRDSRARDQAKRISALADRYLSIVNSSTGGYIANELRAIAQQFYSTVAAHLDAEQLARVERLERQLNLAELPHPKAPQTQPGAREAAFAAVYANPQSDAARFALAALLLAQGDERGELITLQLAQAAGGLNPAGEDVEEDTEERNRLGVLCLPNRLAAWAQPLSNAGTCQFDRGFPAQIALFKNIKPLLNEAACATLHTVVDCHKPPPNDLVAFLNQPSAGSVRRLRGLPQKCLAALATSPRPWTELELHAAVGPTAAQWAALPDLTRLELQAQRLPPDCFSPLRKLETLRLELDGGAFPLALPARLRSLELRVSGELPTIDWGALTELRVLKLHVTKPIPALSLPRQLKSLSLVVPRLPTLMALDVLEEAVLMIDEFSSGALHALSSITRLELWVMRSCPQPFPSLDGLSKLTSLKLHTPYETSFSQDFLRLLPRLCVLEAATDYRLGAEHLGGIKFTKLERLRMPLSAIEASELQEAHLTLPAQLEDLHRFLVRAPKLLQLKLECLPSGPINGSLSEAQPARWRELVNVLENSSVRKVTLTFTQSSVELQRSPDNTLSRLTLYNASGLYAPTWWFRR